MHIQEGTNTTLTTCTKMTEEVDRRHGVNGNSSSNGASEDVAPSNTAHTATGGRLKFFKDGKFILELVRGCAREGDRGGWVSVPRKTFWPPAGPPTAAAIAHPPRAERAASLSVSDDNSSIQSSPWQRDHCWKQNTPRRNISKELTFYYCRPSTLSNATITAGTRRKRRRPHDQHGDAAALNGARKHLSNGVSNKKENCEADSPGGRDVVDAPPSTSAERSRCNEDERRAEYDKTKYYHMKLKKPQQYHKLKVYKKTRPATSGKRLIDTVDRLREKTAALPAPVNAKLVNCKRDEHAMVSPRKRILREMERVSLEEGAKRRAATSAPPPGPSRAPPATPPTPPNTHKLSDYSISSLLDERRGRPSPPPLPYAPYAYRAPPPPPLWVQYAGGWPPPPPPHALPLHAHLPPPPPHHHHHHHHHPALLAMHPNEHNNDLPLNLSKH